MEESPRDETWDALTEKFGEVRTPAERARRNAAVKELKDAGATVEEIDIAYDYCVSAFPNCTEMAVVGHFGRAQHEHAITKSRVNRGNMAAVIEMANRTQVGASLPERSA